MVITFSVGSRCALMLPRKLINQQLTPAKGIIINRLVDNRSLVLIEEVWQFKGLATSPIEDKIPKVANNIKSHNWGWVEVPNVIVKKDYLVLPVQTVNMMNTDNNTLKAMVSMSIKDFTELNKFLV